MSISATLATMTPSDQTDGVDIITFAESKNFLNVKLFPVQRFLLKLVYGLPLSEKLKEPIIIPDQFNEKVIRVFNSEVEFLNYLYLSERVNSKDFDHPIIEVYLVIGRRGTKTFISSVMACYSLYKLLLHESPQKYLGVVETSEIGVAVCSNSVPNAARQLREISNLTYRSEFFKPFLNGEPTADGFTLKTKAKIRDKNAGLVNISVFAATPSVRGGSNVLVIGDEFAHFIDSNQSTKKDPLDKKLYEALTPSVSGFMTPDGEPFGKAIFITSPNGKKGEVWEVKQTSKDRKDILFINVPTWWVNPRVSGKFLRAMYLKSERSFRQEYGAEFIERESTWLPNTTILYASKDMHLQNSVKNARPMYKYYMGIDLALKNDGAAISICHYQPKYERAFDQPEFKDMVVSDGGMYVFDYIGVMQAEHGGVLSIEDVVEWIVEVRSAFHVIKGGYDQWCSTILRKMLTDKNQVHGLIEMVATQTSNSDWGRTYRQVLLEGRMVYPDDDSYINEVIELKEYINGRFVKIENPYGHDDRFNSSAKAIYLCYTDKNKGSTREAEKKAVSKAIRTRNKNNITNLYKNRSERKRLR